MNESTIPLCAIKGRGAVSQLQHRFSSEAREIFDDGWDLQVDEKSSLRTQIFFEDAKSAISKNNSPDISFEYSVNPYRGCEHGCIYCYARPTHSYLNLSPGLDFETKIFAKRNIAKVLAKEFQQNSYIPKLVNVGSATDCYQPVERELGITREILSVFKDANHPVSLITKSGGVERDIDLLSELARNRLATVCVTITSLCGKLARTLEPRAASPQRRLRIIRNLADAGIPVGISVSPQIPFVTEDMEQVLAAAKDAGASSAFYQIIRLPWEVNPLFQEWLEANFPDRAERVMRRIREMRGGKDYDSNFASRMKGTGVWAEMIAQRFRVATKKLGLNNNSVELDTTRFRPPSNQADLFA